MGAAEGEQVGQLRSGGSEGSVVAKEGAAGQERVEPTFPVWSSGLTRKAPPPELWSVVVVARRGQPNGRAFVDGVLTGEGLCRG